MKFPILDNPKLVANYRKRFCIAPIGLWCTHLGGGFEITHGTNILFRSDGTGVETSWGVEYEGNTEFQWHAVADLQIKIVHKDRTVEVKYDFYVRESEYGIPQVCIFQPEHSAIDLFGDHGFWLSFHPLVHQEDLPKHFLSRWLRRLTTGFNK